MLKVNNTYPYVRSSIPLREKNTIVMGKNIIVQGRQKCIPLSDKPLFLYVWLWFSSSQSLGGCSSFLFMYLTLMWSSNLDFLSAFRLYYNVSFIFYHRFMAYVHKLSGLDTQIMSLSFWWLFHCPFHYHKGWGNIKELCRTFESPNSVGWRLTL